MPARPAPFDLLSRALGIPCRGRAAFKGVALRLDIRSNIRDVQRGLNDATRRQIPFAASVAINETLGDVKANADKRLRKTIDRPTPFTMRAFRVRRSSKSRLSGKVEAAPVQNEYLARLEEGGTRTPSGRAIVVPGKIRLNRYGNMARRALANAKAAPAVFVASSSSPRTRHLAAGLYRRGKGRGGKPGPLVRLASFVSSASYSARLRFADTARKTADARLAFHMERAIRRALASAR